MFSSRGTVVQAFDDTICILDTWNHCKSLSADFNDERIRENLKVAQKPRLKLDSAEQKFIRNFYVLSSSFYRNLIQSKVSAMQDARNSEENFLNWH